jgi:hypothetical protein
MAGSVQSIGSILDETRSGEQTAQTCANACSQYLATTVLWNENDRRFSSSAWEAKVSCSGRDVYTEFLNVLFY